MSLIIQLNSGSACPGVQCDQCGKIIDDPGIGVAVWDEPSPQAGTIYGVHFYHKECERQMRPRKRAWMQLDEYLARVLKNLGVTAKKLKEVEAKMDRLSGLGP
jgi:hypothetical protein